MMLICFLGIHINRMSICASHILSPLLLYQYLFRMTYCITSRRGTSKLLELVPNPFDDIKKNILKQTTKTVAFMRPSL